MRILRLGLCLITLLAASPVAAESARWARLPEPARQALGLRQAVRPMQRDGRVRTAHPEVARKLSQDLTTALGRPVQVAARNIIQVVWGSPEHQALRQVLKGTVGVGIYPSKTWGHSKVRLGDLVSDSVPGGARPFPSTGTRARMVPFEGMHNRYYEAVFGADPVALQDAVKRTQGLVAEKCTTGMGCASFASRVMRDYLKDSASKAPLSAAAAALTRSESAAGPLWKKAAGASPALLIVYTPPGDHRDVSHPGFKFDYALK